MKHVAFTLVTFVLTSLEVRAAPWTLTQDAAATASAELARSSGAPQLQRWREFVAHIESDPAKNNAAIAAAREQKDFEFLEQIALYTRSAEAACRELAQADAPGWPRCAAWCLAKKSDSHTYQAARDLLLGQPELALGWFQANPPRNVHERNLLTELEAKEPMPRADSRYLPAFDPQVVFAALEPNAVSVLGEADRTIAIERALEGYAHLFEHDEPWRAWVLALTRHADDRVKSAAYRAMTRFQALEVPIAQLWNAVEDASIAPAMRELALLSFSFGSPIATYARLHGVANDPSHPAWRTAVSRLGDVGDEFTLVIFDELSHTELLAIERAQLDTERKRVDERLAGQDGERAKRVQGLLERAAWADLTCHPLEQRIVGSMMQTLEGWAVTQAVRDELRTLSTSYTPVEEELDHVDPQVMTRRVRKYAHKLAQD